MNNRPTNLVQGGLRKREASGDLKTSFHATATANNNNNNNNNNNHTHHGKFPNKYAAASRQSVDANRDGDQSAKAGLLIAILEGAFCLMEFLFGLVLVKSFTQAGLLYVVRFYTADETTELSALLIMANTLFANLVIVTWTLFRLSNRMGLSTHILFARMTRKPWLTKVGVLLVCLHLGGALLMAGSQLFLDKWLFSFSNYYTDTGEVDYLHICEMLLLAPVREEFVFRAVMFCIFYRRIGDQSADSKIKCVWICSIVFGLIHLLNLFGQRFQPTYILVQIVCGVLIGMLYSFRFVLNGSLLETLLLHIANNLFASFLPLDLEFSLRDPLLSLPLLQTIVIYTLLNYWMHQKLRATEDGTPFDVVDVVGESHTATASKPQQQQN